MTDNAFRPEPGYPSLPGAVYLAGPIAGLSYEEAVDWRGDARVLLGRHGIAAYSPMRGKAHLMGVEQLDSGHAPEHPVTTYRAIFDRDRFDVERCDVLLVNLLGADRLSIGTIMEMAWAHLLRKPVVLVIEPSGNPHDGHAMLSQCASFRVDSLGDALQIVRGILNT